MNSYSLKKTALLASMILPCLVIVSVLSFSALSPKEGMKISLSNLALGSSDKTKTILSSLPGGYSLKVSKQKDPSLAGEKKAVKLVETIIDEIFNKKEKSIYDIQNDYFEPIDKERFLNDDEYTSDRLTRSIDFTIPPCVSRTHDSKLTKPIETQISYSSPNKYIVKALLSDVAITITEPQWQDLNCSLPPSSLKRDDSYRLDQIYEYTIIRDPKTDKYMFYNLTWQVTKDLDAFRNQVATTEKNEYNTGTRLTSTNNFTPAQAEGYNYDKVKNIDQAKVNNIFTINGPKTVTITAAGPNGMGAASGYGFFVRKGVVATSWKVVEGLLKQDIIGRYATGFDGKLHKISGVISASPELDIAFLKLEEEFGEPVTFGDPKKLKEEDPVIVIGSPMGLNPITRVGIFSQLITEGMPTIRNSLPLGEGDMGSPLFNLDGEVIGLNTSVGDKKIESDTSLARPSSLFQDLSQKLVNQNFKDIKTTSFSDLTKKINTVTSQTKRSKVSESNGLWKNYKKLPDITQYKSIQLLESYITGGYLSIRYKNSISDFMKTSVVIDAYVKKLENAGFKLVYKNKASSTYTKGKEIIRITERYDYMSVIYGDQG